VGTAINVSCGKCRYNGSFMLGTGKYYVLVENCLEALPEKNVDEVNSLLSKYPLKNFTFEYELYQCDHCTFLFDHGDLQIFFENGMTYVNKIDCPACQHDMSNQHTPIEKIHELTCPICLYQGEMSLTAEMDWN